MTSQQTSVKYVIEARVEVDGAVDKNDVIGAVFGQTEGIFSADLDLRELQKTGRIGRIEVHIQGQGDRTVGKVLVPTNVDRFHTALIAAMVESVDRVGPYSARVSIEKIEDVRAEKRKRIVERARSLLIEWERRRVPEVDEALKELEETIAKARVVEVGPDNLPAGPEALTSEEVIIVEGRADVVNLLRHGYLNAIGVEGVKVPYSLEELVSRKKVIAFLDGDRGGDMILRELARRIKIDSVARAPPGKEVESLGAKEIAEALANTTPLADALRRIGAHVEAERGEHAPAPLERLKKYIEEVEGSLMAVGLSDELSEVFRVPVSELYQRLSADGQVKYVVFDGVVTQRLVDMLKEKGREVLIVGARVADNLQKAGNVRVYNFESVRRAA
ncbi:MAG: DNA primase DnaG [Thaumarchaeota archaeon]|nr:DNA primase DnaG [Candidatus Calditenuaceae archaeon]MDW8186628.1 DNA primase DnaG [Nitrososphaerota archaeon]